MIDENLFQTHLKFCSLAGNEYVATGIMLSVAHVLEIRDYGYILHCLLRTNSCGILDKNLPHKAYASKNHKHAICVLNANHKHSLQANKIGNCYQHTVFLASRSSPACRISTGSALQILRRRESPGRIHTSKKEPNLQV